MEGSQPQLDSALRYCDPPGRSEDKPKKRNKYKPLPSASTFDTTGPKKLVFPQESHAGRRKRLKKSWCQPEEEELVSQEEISLSAKTCQTTLLERLLAKTMMGQ